YSAARARRCCRLMRIEQPTPMQSAAMLWTGGKDCSLALYEAGRDGYDVRCLVTFAPLNPKFLAHPPAFIKMQAQALALPHYILSIREPFEKSYETALGELRHKMGIRTAITDLRGVRDRTGLDLCGEEGEYHTLVTDGPSFTRPVRIRSHSKRIRDLLAYLEIHELEFVAP